MAWEENSRICLHMQLIAILSRTGVINSIEEIEFYKNRKIRERLNKEILLHYLKKMGISFWDIDKSVTDYFIVKRSV